MGIHWFLKNVGADVALFIFYYFHIQEIHGLVRYFMGEFNGWFNTVEVLYKGGKGTFASFPNVYKNVVDEPYPINYVVGLFRSVYKCVFNRPIYTFAKLGAALVPIAIPLTWTKLLLSNVKFFNLGTFSRRQACVFAEG